MNKAFILIFLSFSVLKINAQNTPCDYKRGDWQTAASTEDGTIQFFVENAVCTEGGICGQPKIGLKHTFNKPIWFKIKLSGYDCDNQLIESTFQTGAIAIEPNKEYLSQQNWHLFKKVIKILNVEVNYDKIIPQTLSFNEEKVLSQAPVNTEIKANKIESPSKKAEEKLTEKEQVSPKLNENDKSVVAANTVDKKAKSKTKEQKTKPAPTQENDAISPKNTDNFNEDNTKLTTSKIDEKKIEKTTDTKPEEPKTPVTETPVAKKEIPAVVKYENAETNTQAVNTETKVEKPAPQPEKKIENTPKQVKTKPEKPNKAVANKPNAPKVTLDTTPHGRLNILKTNLLYPLSIGFERHIAKNISIVANGFYFPGISYGKANGKLGYLELSNPSTGFSAEARYYTSKTKPRLNGWFMGGFYSIRNADVLIHKISTSTNESIDAEITIPTGIGILGLMVGNQKMRKKGFTTDWSFGLGYFEAFNIPEISSDAKAPFDRISPFTKYTKGIAPRATFSIGYAF